MRFKQTLRVRALRLTSRSPQIDLDIAPGEIVGVAGLLGADWQTVLAIGGLAIVMLVILILMRRQIIGAFKDIREGLA